MVGFVVPSLNLTIKRNLGKQKIKNEHALDILSALPLAQPATQ